MKEVLPVVHDQERSVNPNGPIYLTNPGLPNDAGTVWAFKLKHIHCGMILCKHQEDFSLYATTQTCSPKSR